METSNRDIYREQFLKHYGIRGMRWGVRKRRVTTLKTGRVNSSKGQNRRMSNKELTSKVKRLKLEQEYKKLTAPPKTTSRVEKIVKTAGTVAALSGSALTIYKNLNELGVIKK